MYYDSLIFEISNKGRVGYSLPKSEFKSYKIPVNLLRETEANLPEVSELEAVRHYTNVSTKNFGVEKGFYPLGSCTMKYNPKINQDISNMSQFSLHPYAPMKSVQGILEIYYETQRILSELSGLDTFSLNPYAGAHGELAGLMIMRKYHMDRNDSKRTKVIVPDSAHGTNPASATVAGLQSVEVKSNLDGTVDIESLKLLLNDEIAGIMLTNPNTAGVFEKDILEIAKLVHDVGGLLYYDGANLNPILGLARPGDMGFDIMHINLHKTFSTPHGGGGPGSGPIGVVKHLVKYLPSPVIKKQGEEYIIEDSNKTSIGQVTHFYGNIGVVVKAYTYLLTVGKENMANIGRFSVLNANYIKESLKTDYLLPIEGICKHEFVFDGLIDKSHHVTTLDVAKRLLDYDVHPPTVYFPLTFKESLMIEPPETESKATIDDFIEVMRTVAEEARVNPELVKGAPYNTVVKRLDEATAARKPIVKYSDLFKMRDLVIIGAGPGGFDTAIHAKEHGLDVTLIERHKVGGTCLNYGCIPTKTLYHNAKTIKNMKDLDVFGVEVKDFKVNYETIKLRKETIVENQINNILTSIKKLGIELIQGEANIISPNKVEVNGEIIEAKNIIIATGSIPKRIPFEGNDFDIVHDSEDILSLETFPKKMVVIGAGVIGSEMATIFNHFDCEVTLVEYLDEILPPLDKDIKKRARNLFKRSGINIYTKSALKKVIKKDGKYFAVVESKGKMLEIETDYVLLATGRAPSFGNLDLDKLGIEYSNLGIKVNDNFETSVKGIYAIGDVTGILMLAHKATYDGYKVVSQILGKDMDINFNQVPSVVFSFPEISSVGVTEQELAGKVYRTNKYLFKTNAKAECLNETDGFVKMIVDEDDILVGAHIIGAHASDLIHELTTIMYKKINIYEYQNIIHAHPTISEVVGECIKKF